MDGHGGPPTLISAVSPTRVSGLPKATLDGNCAEVGGRLRDGEAPPTRGRAEGSREGKTYAATARSAPTLNARPRKARGPANEPRRGHTRHYNGQPLKELPVCRFSADLVPAGLGIGRQGQPPDQQPAQQLARHLRLAMNQLLPGG